MYIDPTILAVATGLVGATGAMIWSYLMASKVAAPRAKRLIVEALTTEGAELKAVREHLINPALEATETRFNEQTASNGDEIAESIESALNARLEAFSNELGPTVSQHVMMAFRQVEAQQAKRTGEFLKQMGIDEQLEGLEEEVRQEAMAQMGPQAQIAMEILNTKIPKKASIIEKTIMQFAKAQAAQLVQGNMMGADTTHVEAPSTSRGFGVR